MANFQFAAPQHAVFPSEGQGGAEGLERTRLHRFCDAPYVGYFTRFTFVHFPDLPESSTASVT
jgi:hypothetical protein